MAGQDPKIDERQGAGVSPASSRPRRQRPIVHYLIAAALVTLVPGFVFAGLLIEQNHVAQQETLETLMLASARGVTQAVEREIGANITTLRVLAASPSLRDRDYEGFYERSRLALDGSNATLFIVNPDLSTFASTRLPYASPPNRTNAIEAAQLAFASGKVTVSDVIRGSVSGELVYNILLPVAVPEDGVKLIALNQQVGDLASVISSNSLPQGWNAALLDTSNQILTGTAGAGERGTVFAFPQLTVQPDYYRWRQGEANGEPVLAISQRSVTTGWTVVVWAPIWTLFQPLFVSVLYLAGGGVILLALMVAGLFWVNRRIAQSVRGLARDAQRLGAGEEVWARAYPIVEIAEVSQALSAASEQRQAAEAEVRFLMRELAHRSKNQMTVIAAMAKQTARGAESVGGYVEAFERRILGLARSTDLLLANGRSGVSLGELVQSQIASFSPADATRVRVEGPPFRLNMQSAQILGMAVHELSTNAVKYGCFADDTGTLRVHWSHRGDRLDLVWRETVPGGVAEGERVGFGTTVLKTMVGGSLKAEVERIHHADGMEWRFSIPHDSLALEHADESTPEAAQ